MYLSEDTWRKNGVRKDADIHYYTSVGNMFPNCAKYSDELTQIVKSKDIDVHYTHTIQSVDKDNRKATFKTAKGDLV
jgi:NADPH-dependent 2,4-dienoyl-CoA reductase/sulfur reductase-like enzyme